MRGSIEQCEIFIARLLGRKYCVLTNSGTTALYLAYSLLGNKRPKVLLPALMCANPMWAAHYAGKIPIFSDIAESTATINPDSVGRLLKKDKAIGIVLAVHLYGNPAAMEELKHVCSKYGVSLVEDLAQALGGISDNGVLFGSSGDCAVVSFGYSKIIDVGGGGAFLTDDASIAAAARRLQDRLKMDYDCGVEKLNLFYRKLFYAIWECGQNDTRFYTMFDSFPELFRNLFLRTLSDGIASNILHSLGSLQEEVLWRRKIAKVYTEALRGIPSIKPITSGAGVPWRFTFRMPPEKRNSLLEGVRAAQYDISSWYPCITQWTLSGRKQGKKIFPIANKLEREVVNLWVGRDYNENRVLLLVKVIKKILAH